MDKKQQENRQRAARKFMTSLDELKAVLQSETSVEPQTPPEPEASRSPEPRSPGDTDLETVFDEAARDIERFMAERPDSAS